MEYASLIVAVAAIAGLYIVAQRARTIAVCEIELGRLRVARGRLSPKVASELRDVVTRTKVHRATVVIFKEDGKPALRFSGSMDPRAQQQIRNVVGRFKIAELRG